MNGGHGREPKGPAEKWPESGFEGVGDLGVGVQMNGVGSRESPGAASTLAQL